MKTDVLRSTHPGNQATETLGTILIVEDNPKNRKLARSLLQINHFDVLEAADAEAGIQIATERRPDLILMDIQLPGMDGLKATQILKAKPELQDISIVALTSYAMEGDSQKAKQAGCDGYITKPIDTRKFIDHITPFLHRTETNSASEVGQEDPVKPTILIVDDEPMNLKLLRAKLLKHYPRIIEATNGKEALEKANEIIPDIILLDIMMPLMNGFEVTRKLKINPKTKYIPIILITALDGHDYKVMGFEAGADEFLNKPIKTFELLTRVKSLLDMKQYEERLTSAACNGKDGCSVEQAKEGLDFPNQKIQVVLNDTSQHQKIRMYLFGQPYEIETQADNQNLIDSIRENAPDILIIDSQLKTEDFITLSQAIRQNQETGNCQLLYVTSEKDLEQHFSQIEDYVDDFLTQPFNIYELRARIKVLLKKKLFIDKLFNGPTTNIQHVITDQLTGLYNFEYCKHVLKHEIQRSVREHSKVSLVMMEVNKQLLADNAVGHFAGEPLFDKLSQLIKKSIRKLDIASRRSERTFAFVLPEADDEKSQGFIKRMIGLIDSQLTAVTSSKQPTERSFIFGYAVCPDDSDRLDNLIRIADAALEANKADRNKGDAIAEQAEKIHQKGATD